MSDRPIDRGRRAAVGICGVLLPLFVLFEVNYPRLDPQAQLAVFATLGLMLVFLAPRPGALARPPGALASWAAVTAAAATLVVGAFVVVQSERSFARWWLEGQSLGDRAGLETGIDIVMGSVGLVLVLTAAWKAVGPALPLLSLAFLIYGLVGSRLPDWLMPHRGYDLDRLVSQTFLHSQGVFGVALGVMLTYVFLFVVFGSLLEATGATRFIIDWSRRAFRSTSGGPAKVAVISSGLMGSLSGSAVANTASTGTFTIPMMKSAGLAPRTAAGLEAAASSGGALVPPVMGAGAYMMLEIVDPPVTYLEIMRAALIPAVLYYLTLFLIVHFRGLRQGPPADAGDAAAAPRGGWEGVVFVGGLAALVGLLLSGYTVFRAVTLAAVLVVGLAAVARPTRLSFQRLIAALRAAAAAGTALVAAAACVGIVIGVVTLTGIGTRLPALVLPLAQDNLLLALLVIMVSSLVLGMGLPSAVCYLLMATLIGPVLSRLGVVPLAAHLFIFYFGMMSMVTPPVALAAYAASSIAGSNLMETGVSAFRFALVGFTLPFVFVFRPQLLMLAPGGGLASPLDVTVATLLAAAGTVALAAATAGYARRALGRLERLGLFVAAAMLFYPGPNIVVSTLSVVQSIGLALLAALVLAQLRRAVG